MRRLVASFVALIIFLTAPTLVEAGKVPKHFLDSARDDPAVNYPLRKYGVPDEDPLVHFYRTGALLWLINQCQGAKFNEANWRRYRSGVDLDAVSKVRKDQAWFAVFAAFNQIQVNEHALLCAGASTLFGKKGIMLRDVITVKFNATAAYNPDSANSYLMLDGDFIRKFVEWKY